MIDIPLFVNNNNSRPSDAATRNSSLIIDSPIVLDEQRPIIDVDYVKHVTLSAYLGNQLTKSLVYFNHKRPARLQVIQDNIWIILEDGTITVLASNGDFIQSLVITVRANGNHSGGSNRFGCNVTGVVATQTGDVIVSCMGLINDAKDQRISVAPPGLGRIDSEGVCCDVIDYDPYLDVTHSRNTLHALRKADRNVIEYNLSSGEWQRSRKIELVPNTQYTRLTAHAEYLYASSVLPDIIHKVHIQTCRIKTLGFRGSGAAGELRSPRVSFVDADGVVLALADDVLLTAAAAV